MRRLIQRIEENRVLHFEVTYGTIEEALAVTPGAEIYEGSWPEGAEYYLWDEVTETVVADEVKDAEDKLETKRVIADETAEAEVPKTITITLGNQSDTFPLNERYMNIVRNEIYFQELEGSDTMSLLNSKYEILTVPLNVGRLIFREMWKEYRKVIGRKAQLAQARKKSN